MKVLSIVKGDYASMKLTNADNTSKTFTLHAGESLGSIDNDLDGVVIEAISKNSVSLSNGQE